MRTADDADDYRVSRLWRQMSADQRIAAADAFWRDENLAIDQAQAVEAIARQIKFRSRSVAALPLARKSRHLATLPTLSDLLIGRLLISYHLSEQRPMMAAFLDQLGIKHEEGLITEENVPAQDPAALAAAARTLVQTYPPADVALYLATLITQDPESWSGLAGLSELSALEGR